MPRKQASKEGSEEENQDQSQERVYKDDEVANLNRMLAAVLNYLSDEEIEEIDIEYLLNNTDGLKEWWDQYREKNRKQIEEEIKKSLEQLPLEELESIREKIKGNMQ
jgi:hypothetical protein